MRQPDPTSWPYRGAQAPPEVRVALLDHARDDAMLLGLDPAAYETWLADGLADHPQTASRRADLATAALQDTPLSDHVRRLLTVADLRRARALSTTAMAEMARWNDAEVQLTVSASQKLHDDPCAPRNRLATLGKAAGTLGHELRNPLGVIQSSIYLLNRRPIEDEKTRRHIDKIERQASNCHRIVEDLMHLAGNAPARLESLDVAQAFALALDEAALPSTITAHIQAPTGHRVQADAGLLQRVLVNLLRNTNTALRGHGEVWLGLTVDDDTHMLWVRDNGPGFEASMLEEAFDPLATTAGIGLGLALVDNVMRRHGGWAVASNAPEGGAVVTLHFRPPKN